MKVAFFLAEKFHHKPGKYGSSRIRGHQLIKYWPEAELYQYGANPDVMIFQKVYCTQDWKFPIEFKGLKILDICDPDWLEGGYLKETIDAMDAVTCPTQALADFLKQLTDKPVVIIPDRHDIESVQPLKEHIDTGEIWAVWFGYRHNADTMRDAILTVENLGINLVIISDDDPALWRYGSHPEVLKEKVHFEQYKSETILEDLARYDIAILPKGTRPQDRFKSDNKTTLAWLAGLPVATTGDELRLYLDPGVRNEHAKRNYAKAIAEFDVKLSVKEYQQLIGGLKHEN